MLGRCQTGERYNAARRALIEQAQRREDADGGGRTSAAEPELSDEAITEATGRGWDAWVELIEADPVAEQGHTTVSIGHEKLPTSDDVELWKEFWADWLAALAD